MNESQKTFLALEQELNELIRRLKRWKQKWIRHVRDSSGSGSGSGSSVTYQIDLDPPSSMPTQNPVSIPFTYSPSTVTWDQISVSVSNACNVSFTIDDAGDGTITFTTPTGMQSHDVQARITIDGDVVASDEWSVTTDVPDGSGSGSCGSGTGGSGSSGSGSSGSGTGTGSTSGSGVGFGQRY